MRRIYKKTQVKLATPKIRFRVEENGKARIALSSRSFSAAVYSRLFRYSFSQQVEIQKEARSVSLPSHILSKGALKTDFGIDTFNSALFPVDI